MTDDNNKDAKIVPVSPETNALVEQEMSEASEPIKAETKALVEAIKKRAQSEVKNAKTITQDAYLNAVRSAKEEIEENKLLDSEKIEHSFEMIQKDAQANWQKTVDEIAALGDRIQEAAQVAWDIIMGKEKSDDK